MSCGLSMIMMLSSKLLLNRKQFFQLSRGDPRLLWLEGGGFGSEERPLLMEDILLLIMHPV